MKSKFALAVALSLGMSAGAYATVLTVDDSAGSKVMMRQQTGGVAQTVHVNETKQAGDLNKAILFNPVDGSMAFPKSCYQLTPTQLVAIEDDLITLIFKDMSSATSAKYSKVTPLNVQPGESFTISFTYSCGALPADLAQYATPQGEKQNGKPLFKFDAVKFMADQKKQAKIA